MKTPAYLLITFVVLILQINSAKADSPLTSTIFYKAYLDVPMVQEALNSKGKITNELLEFISNETNALDIKLAVVNAIGWDHKGISNSKLFLKYIVKKKRYKSNFENINMDFKINATADELICFAYLRALDNYFDVDYAFTIANESLKKLGNSCSINLVTNLIKAQVLFSIEESCLASHKLHSIQSNTQLIMDMRKDAVDYFFEYIDSVTKNCR